MKTLLRRAGFVLAGLALLLMAVFAFAYAASAARLNKTYDVPDEAIPIPTDAESIARGQHLVKAVGGCAGCHGADLGGAEFINIPAIAVINAPNLTSGQGGLGREFTAADFVRALRHGLNPQRTSMWIMPSENFYSLSDSDLGAVIAYLQSLPPVDRQMPERRLGPAGRVLLAANVAELLSAEKIDHFGPRPAAPAPGVTADFGDYLVRVAVCRTCHGPELAGAQPPDPSAPRAPNLTPGGELGRWTEADFIATLRTGATPGGHPLDESMPWKAAGQMTDDELQAIFIYLKSRPALPTVK